MITAKTQENGKRDLIKGQSVVVPAITSETEKIIQDFHAFQGVVMPRKTSQTQPLLSIKKATEPSIGMNADGGKSVTQQPPQILLPSVSVRAKLKTSLRPSFFSPKKTRTASDHSRSLGETSKKRLHYHNATHSQKPTLGPSPSEPQPLEVPPLVAACFLGTLPMPAVKFQKIQETLLPFIHIHGLGVYMPMTTSKPTASSHQSDIQSSEPQKKKQKLMTSPTTDTVHQQKQKEVPSLQDRLSQISNYKEKWNPWPKSVSCEDHYKGVNIGGFLSIEKYLGGGTFGRVYKGKITWPMISDLDGKYVAAKFFGKTTIKCDDNDTNYARRGFLREAEMMASITNHFITVLKEPSPVVSLLGTFAYLTPNFKNGVTCNPVILMECMDLGSVTDLLKKAKKTKNKFYVFSLIISLITGMSKVLNDLHRAKYYHQDIKPSNFMCKSLAKLSKRKSTTLTCGSSSSTMIKELDKDPWVDYVWDPFTPDDKVNYSLKIADMGFTCSLGDPVVVTAGRPTGTTLYVAPEFKEMSDRGVKRISDPSILEASEVYSIGCSFRDMFWKTRKVFNIEPETNVFKVDRAWEKEAKLRARNEYLKKALATITVDKLIGLGNGSLQDCLISKAETHLKGQNYEREQIKRFSCSIINEFLELEKVIAHILSPIPKSRPSLSFLIEKASSVQNSLNDYILYVTKFQP